MVLSWLGLFEIKLRIFLCHFSHVSLSRRVTASWVDAWSRNTPANDSFSREKKSCTLVKLFSMHLCMSFMCSSQEWIKWALFAFAFMWMFFIEKTAIQNNSHKYDWFDNTKLLISSFFSCCETMIMYIMKCGKKGIALLLTDCHVWNCFLKKKYEIKMNRLKWNSIILLIQT